MTLVAEALGAIFFVLLAASCMAFGLAKGGLIGYSVLVFGVAVAIRQGAKGWIIIREDAHAEGLVVAVVRPLLVASICLCMRRINNGHWF